MYRVEDKYFCSERELFLLQTRLETVLRPDVYQAGTEGYQVTSVYFDDLQDTHLKDTADGNRLREKYRIRIYNGSFKTIKLEVKYKRDNRVLKKSRSITFDQMTELLKGGYIPEEGSSLDDPIMLFNLAISKRGLRPKVIVTYERKAYVFDAGNVRITLDRNIRAGNRIDAFVRGEKVDYESIKDMDRVLEVKYDEFLPGFIAGILENGNMLQTSYSKYRICREIKRI